MGLLKETMQAIIRIDQNMNEIRKELAWERDAKYFRATYMQKPIEPKGSTFDRVMTEKDFCYPDNLTFGGRIRAIRLFVGLTQFEFGSSIDVSNGHISNVERDEDVLSMRAIKDVADKFGISRDWIATGHLPQTTEEPAKPLATCKVTPLSGYGEPAGNMCQTDLTLQSLRGTYSRCDPKELLKESTDRVHQARIEVEEELGIQEDSR